MKHESLEESLPQESLQEPSPPTDAATANVPLITLANEPGPSVAPLPPSDDHHYANYGAANLMSLNSPPKTKPPKPEEEWTSEFSPSSHSAFSPQDPDTTTASPSQHDVMVQASIHSVASAQDSSLGSVSPLDPTKSTTTPASMSSIISSSSSSTATAILTDSGQLSELSRLAQEASQVDLPPGSVPSTPVGGDLEEVEDVEEEEEEEEAVALPLQQQQQQQQQQPPPLPPPRQTRRMSTRSQGPPSPPAEGTTDKDGYPVNPKKRKK